MKLDPQLFLDRVDVSTFQKQILAAYNQDATPQRVAALVQFLRELTRIQLRHVARYSVVKSTAVPALYSEIATNSARLEIMTARTVAAAEGKLSTEQFDRLVVGPLIFGVSAEGASVVPFAAEVVSVTNQITAVDDGEAEAWGEFIATVTLGLAPRLDLPSMWPAWLPWAAGGVAVVGAVSLVVWAARPTRRAGR